MSQEGKHKECKMVLLAACFHTGLFLGLFFNLENRGNMCLQNISLLSTHYMALYSKRQNSSATSI
jgi:hypothetical protein